MSSHSKPCKRSCKRRLKCFVLVQSVFKTFEMPYNVCYEKFVTHLLLYTVANVSRIFRNRRYKTSYETLNGKKYLAFDRQIDRT